MDAFYAAVEQRDNPSLRGKPVIVGGDPRRRGVVSTCSYEARKYGVHSAMPSSTAVKLCPQGIFVRPRFEAYMEVSRIVHGIMSEYTDRIESVSLDEAYLDVTEDAMPLFVAADIARQIQNAIFSRTSLTASAGLSYNKFLAKCASEHRKPGGLTVISPERAGEFISSLPIEKFFGVGKATAVKMKNLGIHSGRDLKVHDRDFLVTRFGRVGHYYHDIARGVDNREVNNRRVRKSLGKEVTLERDIDDRNDMLAILHDLAQEVAAGLRDSCRRGRTITLKVRFHDFDSITRSVTLNDPLDDHQSLCGHLVRLLDTTEAGRRKVRLLGVSVTNFDIQEADEAGPQLYFNFS
jgi:DNA polymerase-4